MAEFEERTEQATPRRRQKAKEKGQVARSRELISMAATAGTIVMFYLAGNSFIRKMAALTGDLLSLRHGRNPVDVMRFASTEMLVILMPFFGGAVIFAALAGVLQGGLSFKPLDIEIERLNPLTGLKRLFSRYGMVEFLKGLFKFAAGGFIFYLVMKKALTVIPFIEVGDVRGLLEISGRVIARPVVFAFAVFLILAVLDYLYERWRFERSIRMTRQEIREEYKESEGDPLIKSRIKSLQREMARRRMMQEVPKATVVITNPTHIAVALRYRKEEMSAPMVVAKGAGFLAEKIKEVAGRCGIPVVEDRPLARALYRLKLGSYIPEELYRAVAKILAYIYKLRGAA